MVNDVRSRQFSLLSNGLVRRLSRLFWFFRKRSFTLKNSCFPIALAWVIGLLASSHAVASVTLTPAPGGTAISADTTGGTFASLTGPVLAEGVSGDIGGGTIVLNAPSGFVFDTGGIAPTVLMN